MVSEFEKRRHEVRERLLSAYAEVAAQATEEDDMMDLKDKARGLLTALEIAATRTGLESVESGIGLLQSDLNHAKMALRR